MLKQLNEEEFQRIYTDKAFRNRVAFAHGCCDQYSNHLYYKAGEYKVTEEQKSRAKEERQRAKKEAIANIGNRLILVGMGMDYPARFEGDVCNFRVRTSLINPKGRKFFIEVSKGLRCDMSVDFSIDLDLEKEYEDNLRNALDNRNTHHYNSREWKHWQSQVEKWSSQPYYWNTGIAKTQTTLNYSLESILKLVNDTYECFFTEIEVDEYDLRQEDFICVSPASS